MSTHNKKRPEPKNGDQPLSHMDALERRVCGLIILAEKTARSHGSYLLQVNFAGLLRQFSKQDLIDVARRPGSAQIFWNCAKVLANSFDPAERQCAASTILNLQSVKWRRSQRVLPTAKVRMDLV